MAETGPWIVTFDEGAVRDFEDVKNKGDRRAVLTAVEKLRELGPRLVPPHVKSLQGEAGLNELRPRQGRTDARPIFVRRGKTFVILAVAATHEDMKDAIAEAKERLQTWTKSADV